MSQKMLFTRKPYESLSLKALNDLLLSIWEGMKKERQYERQVAAYSCASDPPDPLSFLQDRVCVAKSQKKDMDLDEPL